MLEIASLTVSISKLRHYTNFSDRPPLSQYPGSAPVLGGHVKARRTSPVSRIYLVRCRVWYLHNYCFLAFRCSLFAVTERLSSSGLFSFWNSAGTLLLRKDECYTSLTCIFGSWARFSYRVLLFPSRSILVQFVHLPDTLNSRNFWKGIFNKLITLVCKTTQQPESFATSSPVFAP